MLIQTANALVQGERIGNKAIARYSVEEVGHSRLHCTQCPYRVPIERTQGFQRFRYKTHLTFENPTYSWLSRLISILVIALIFISTVAFCMETIRELEDLELWYVLEIIVVSVFTFEYVVRMLACHRVLKFVIEPLNIVDLFAVLPFYLELFSSSSDTEAFRVLRTIRLARVFRLFKISRYSSYMQIMGHALKKSTDAFGLLLFFIAIAVVIFSSVMYFAERGSWRENEENYYRSDGKVSPFNSILASFYWCIVSMTTVGYGDVVPLDTWGKVVGCITMVCGLLVIALPITILGSNFQDVYSVHKKVQDTKNAKESEEVQDLDFYCRQLQTSREALVELLTEVRGLLQRRAGHSDFFQVWSTVDYVVLSSLVRIEHFLRRLIASERRAAIQQRHLEKTLVQMGASPMLDTAVAAGADSDRNLRSDRFDFPSERLPHSGQGDPTIVDDAKVAQQPPTPVGVMKHSRLPGQIKLY